MEIPRPDIIGPNLLNEDKAENLKLAKLWSTQGLLCLSPTRPPGDMFSRVFNNLKNDLYDRQIGDRRLMNGGERSISGPSRSLPGGYLITSMHCPAGFQLVGAVTDRKDFLPPVNGQSAEGHDELPAIWVFTKSF